MSLNRKRIEIERNFYEWEELVLKWPGLNWAESFAALVARSQTVTSLKAELTGSSYSFFCVLRMEQLPPRSRSIVRAAHARAHVKTSFRPRHVTDRFGQTFFSLPRCHLCKPTLLFFCCVCSRLSCKLIKNLLGKKKTQKITSLKQQKKNGYVILVLICFQFGNYPRPRPNHWHH